MDLSKLVISHVAVPSAKRSPQEVKPEEWNLFEHGEEAGFLKPFCKTLESGLTVWVNVKNSKFGNHKVFRIHVGLGDYS